MPHTRRDTLEDTTGVKKIFLKKLQYLNCNIKVMSYFISFKFGHYHVTLRYLLCNVFVFLIMLFKFLSRSINTKY